MDPPPQGQGLRPEAAQPPPAPDRPQEPAEARNAPPRPERPLPAQPPPQAARTTPAPGNQPAQEPPAAQEQTRSIKGHSVAHLKLDLNVNTEGPAVPIQGSTINTLLGTGSPSLQQASQLHIFFLPAIHIEKEDRPANPDFCVLLDDPIVCGKLTKHLRLDPFFLTEEAWNSNGFFLGPWNEVKSDISVYSYATRFLIKFLQDPEAQKNPAYSWLFLSFSVLWVKRGKDVSCVLVCYDDSTEIKDHIVEMFENYPRGNIRQSPLSIYDALLRAVALQYDKALWLFRTPVRNIEKSRRQLARSISGLLDQDFENGEGVMGAYIRMHELSRHAIHMSETLQAAAKTLKTALRHMESRPPPVQPEEGVAHAVAGLQFSASFLANLKLRADAFVDRIKNEVQLAYNIISVYQLRDTQLLLQESRDDGKDLTRTVTILTLIFLPPTSVAGYWGMNFIDKDKGRVTTSSDVWQFWAWTIGLVLFCFTFWVLRVKNWGPMLRFFRLFERRPRESKKDRNEA